MQTAFKMLEKVMAREDRISRIAIENLLRVVIPFNAPHGFKLMKLSPREVRIELPNFKLNHNHLGGIHACAMATLGEFCAGMTLARNLGFTRYRFILAELHIDYRLQGRTRLIGTATLNEGEIEELKEKLSHQEKVLFPHTTVITNVHGETVAEVKSVWQVKDWDKVRLR